MSIGNFGLQDLISRDLIKWLEETYDKNFSAQPKPDSDLPKAWEFRGYYHFQNKNLPFHLARETGQKLENFGNDIYGIILPYDHGYDDSFYIPMPHQKFLHLFHAGENGIQVVSGTVDGVEFRETIHPRNRLVLILSTK